MGTPYVGARKEIALTKESTRGTAASHAAGDWQPHLGHDYKPMVEKVKDDPAMGRIEDNIDHEVIHRSSEGPIPLRLTKDFLVDLNNLIFGAEPTPSSLGGGLYQRDYTVQNDNQHQSYTVTVKDPIAGMKRYPLGMLNTADIEFNVDAIATATLNMMGGAEEAASGTPAYDTTYSPAFFVPTQLEIKIDDVGTTDFSSTQETFFSNLTMSVNKNTLKEWALGKEEPADVLNQRFGLGLALEQTYEDTTLRDYAHNRVKKAMQILITDGTHYWQIQLGQVAFEDWSDTNDNNAYLKNTVAVFAERNNTNGTITATVVNQQS